MLSAAPAVEEDDSTLFAESSFVAESRMCRTRRVFVHFQRCKKTYDDILQEKEQSNGSRLNLRIFREFDQRITSLFQCWKEFKR